MKMKTKYIDLLREWEGVRLDAYQDGGGVWTIGYGHTGDVKAGDKITLTQAKALLKDDLAKFEKRVNDLVKVPLNDAQYATLVSFDFNTGALHKSTLLKELNKGNYESVPDELARWVFIKKKKSKGLVNRRAKEAALWVSLDDVEHVNGDIKRGAPSIINKENISWGSGIAATAIAPLADGNGAIQWAVAGVIAVGFAVALYLFLKRRGA